MAKTLPTPDPTRTFASFNKFWAICHTEQGEQTLLWESRITVDQKHDFYTIFDDQEVHVNSINDFLFTHPKCLSLSVPHDVQVLWNGKSQFAKLTEIFSLQPEKPSVVIRLSLDISDLSYLTGECDALTDAIWELEEIIGESTKWWIQTCYHCAYSRPAFLVPMSDRDEMRCYRDAPEAYKEVKLRGKFASTIALHAGHYFVSAFHSCAAWKPLQE